MERAGPAERGRALLRVPGQRGCLLHQRPGAASERRQRRQRLKGESLMEPEPKDDRTERKPALIRDPNALLETYEQEVERASVESVAEHPEGSVPPLERLVDAQKSSASTPAASSARLPAMPVSRHGCADVCSPRKAASRGSRRASARLRFMRRASSTHIAARGAVTARAGPIAVHRGAGRADLGLVRAPHQAGCATPGRGLPGQSASRSSMRWRWPAADAGRVPDQSGCRRVQPRRIRRRFACVSLLLVDDHLRAAVLRPDFGTFMTILKVLVFIACLPALVSRDRFSIYPGTRPSVAPPRVMTLYFAYGANMERAAMRSAVPGATALGIATLRGYRFVIARRLGLVRARGRGACVHGVLWRLTPRDLCGAEHVSRASTAGFIAARCCRSSARAARARALVYVGPPARQAAPMPGYQERVVAAAQDWRCRRAMSRTAPPRARLSRRAPGRDRRDRMNVIRHVVVRGRVQGVGYRAFVEDEALRLGLEGWVRNRRDGTVEAVFSGPDETVAAMIEACRRGPPPRARRGGRRGGGRAPDCSRAPPRRALLRAARPHE